MKISQQNRAVFMGDMPFRKQGADAKEQIAAKKQMHQKEAMHIVTTTHKSEKNLDEDIEGIRNRVRELQSENKKAIANYNDYTQRMLQVQKDYKIEPDSKEQKDLELLQKKYDADNDRLAARLTDEEKEYLKNMGELTEYQKYSMDLYEQVFHWRTTLRDNQYQITGMTFVLRSINIGRLKEHAMTDAQQAKEEILETASKEAIARMVDDAKESLNEKTQKAQEDAKEQEEKEEEQAERIKAAKENRAKVKAAAEATRENISNLIEQMTDSKEVMQDIDEEIKEIMQDIDEEIKKVMAKKKLLEEDLKGLALNVIM